jgi:hypothetical protein
VLGIDVSADVLTRWAEWLAPAVQPFFVESRRGWPKSAAGALSPELGDTYRTWRVDTSLERVWLDEETFSALSRSQRSSLVRAQVEHGRGAVPSVRRWSDVVVPAVLRAQADGHRFVWWLSIVARNPLGVLSRVIDAAPDGGAPVGFPSRHREVSDATWRRCASVLPGARRIAGSFPPSSGPNCFTTVLSGAGVPGIEHEGVLQAPFLAWLDAACRPGGRDDDPGTVLVWRDRDGAPVHGAVTIGNGWALEKASREWWTPRAIRHVSDVVRSARARGQRLERHTIR